MFGNFAAPGGIPTPRERRRKLTTATVRKASQAQLEMFKKRSSVDSKVVINVGGRKFVTYKNTLKRFPHTLLGCEESVNQYYDAVKGEYFIDRDPHIFRYVLNYYRSGKLHRSLEDCDASFEEELYFYGIKPREIHDCCFDEEHDTIAGNVIKDDNASYRVPTVQTKIKRIKNWIWTAVEGEVDRGPRALIGTVSVYMIGFFIILSIFTTVFETVPCEGDAGACTEQRQSLDVLDEICISIFTIEFILRLLVCPSIVKFVKSPMNVIDFLSILPFYLTLFLTSVLGSNLDAFIVLRVLRIFRVFKLSRNSKRLQRFGAMIVSCVHDLASLAFVLLVALILFSSVLYFIERGVKEGQFTSIVDSMWYTTVTMITLGNKCECLMRSSNTGTRTGEDDGNVSETIKLKAEDKRSTYGDMVPQTVLGKIVGGLCCMSGVILISLPIPIIQEKDIFKKEMLSVYNVKELHKKISEMQKAAPVECGDRNSRA